MHSPKRIKVTEVNPHLICVLCRGYYIDATTIIECLHSFCKTCIVKYLQTNKYCPICDVQVHKTSPLLNIRSDKTLQNIVYKLVPSLFKSEMERRVEFYRQHPEHLPALPEDRGEIADNTPVLLPDEVLIICLEYLCDKPPVEPVPKRFLHCPAEMTLGHLAKLIRGKFNLLSSHQVNILFKDDLLPEYLTIMEVAYTYQCRRKMPIHLYYRILELKRTTIRLLEVKERKEEPAPSKASEGEAVKKEKQCEDKVVKAEKRPAMSPLENTVMEKGLVIEKTMEERSSQPGEKVENEWKEVQLQISENGVMSVRNMKNSECSPKPAVEAPQASSGASSPSVAQLSASMTPATHTVSAPVVPTPTSIPLTRPTTSNGPLVSLPSELTTSLVPANYSGPPRIPSSKPILSVSKVTKDQVKKDFNNVEANKLSISRVPAAGFKEKGEALNKIVSKLSPNERVIGNTSVTIRPVLNTHPPPPPPIKTYQPPISQPPIQPQPLPKVQKAERKPQQTVRYKTLTSPTKQWNPSIDRMTMLTMKQNYDMSKPPRFFKQRNMPRYLGNPASGVKPMFGTSNEDASKEQKPRSPTKLPPPFTPGSPKAGKSPYPDKTTWPPRVPSPAHSGSLYNSNPYLLYSGFPGSFNPDPSMLANANPDLVRSMFANSAYHPSLPPSINMLFNPLHNVPRPTLDSPPPMQRIPRTKSPKGDDKVDKPIPNLIPANLPASHVPRSPTLSTSTMGMPSGPSIPPHPSHPPGSLLPPGTSALPPRLPPTLSIHHHNSLLHQPPLLSSPHHPLGSPRAPSPACSPRTSSPHHTSPPKPLQQSGAFSPKPKSEHQKSPQIPAKPDKVQDTKPQPPTPPSSSAQPTVSTMSTTTVTSSLKSTCPTTIPHHDPTINSASALPDSPKITEAIPPAPRMPPPHQELPEPPHTSASDSSIDPKPSSENKESVQPETPADNNNISKEKETTPSVEKSSTTPTPKEN